MPFACKRAVFVLPWLPDNCCPEEPYTGMYICYIADLEIHMQIEPDLYFLRIG